MDLPTQPAEASVDPETERGEAMPQTIEPLSSFHGALTHLEQRCVEKGLKMTEQRRVISRVLTESTDHPDVEQVYRRAQLVDSNISLATVYRTMKLFEDLEVIDKLDFGDGRARYEENREEHHHHLIDLDTGDVVEFKSEELEELKHRIAKELGFDLISHRLELYGRKAKGQ
jgi:Fur family transcriptional regulator, ferric uptake regulator